MIFTVIKTSGYGPFHPPVEEARPLKEYQIDGTNDWVVWAIELNTLEELVAFAKKYGEIVFNSDTDPWVGAEDPKEYIVIEIYNGYRE